MNIREWTEVRIRLYGFHRQHKAYFIIILFIRSLYLVSKTEIRSDHKLIHPLMSWNSKSLSPASRSADRAGGGRPAWVGPLLSEVVWHQEMPESLFSLGLERCGGHEVRTLSCWVHPHNPQSSCWLSPRTRHPHCGSKSEPGWVGALVSTQHLARGVRTMCTPGRAFTFFISCNHGGVHCHLSYSVSSLAVVLPFTAWSWQGYQKACK